MLVNNERKTILINFTLFNKQHSISENHTVIIGDNGSGKTLLGNALTYPQHLNSESPIKITEETMTFLKSNTVTYMSTEPCDDAKLERICSQNTKELMLKSNEKDVKNFFSGYGLDVNYTKEDVTINGLNYRDWHCELSDGHLAILRLWYSIKSASLLYSQNVKTLYIDLPETYLSLNAQSKLVGDLLSLTDKQLIITTHSPDIYNDCILYDFDKLEL